MSDFIKVKAIECEREMDCDSGYVYIFKRDLLLLFKIYTEERHAYAVRIIGTSPTATFPITREEYDRLCKELGVE